MSHLWWSVGRLGKTKGNCLELFRLSGYCDHLLALREFENDFSGYLKSYLTLSPLLQISLSLLGAAPSAFSYLFISINNRSVKQIYEFLHTSDCAVSWLITCFPVNQESTLVFPTCAGSPLQLWGMVHCIRL